jgi:hypothetical protein
LSGFTGFLTFAANPERQAAQEAAHVAFFGASGPKSAPAPLSPDSSPMWITPPERLTGFLTFSHRIPHLQSPDSSFFGPTTHRFSHLLREFALHIKILQQPEEKIF